MDFTKIKKFVTERGDRFILVENGEPALVLMSFSEYEKLAASPQGRNGAAPAEEVLDLPLQKTEWELRDAEETELFADEAVEGRSSHTRLEEVRLEDLPL